MVTPVTLPVPQHCASRIVSAICKTSRLRPRHARILLLGSAAMKIACKTQPSGRDFHLVRRSRAGDRRMLAIFVSIVQSMLFLLLLQQGDWRQTRQAHLARGQSLADAQDPRNLHTGGSETPRALAASADRQRFKVRLSDASDAALPCQACMISGPDGHALHADARPGHPAQITISAYRARAPPLRII